MSASLASLDDNRIGAHAYELAGKAECRREAKHPCSVLLDPAHRRATRQAARQHDIADAMGSANVDELDQPRMQSDQIDPKGPFR